MFNMYKNGRRLTYWRFCIMLKKNAKSNTKEDERVPDQVLFEVGTSLRLGISSLAFLCCD